MDYSTFVNVMMKKIEEVLESGTSIQKQFVTKNNGRKRMGIIFRTSGINVAPAIYLEEYYQKYREGEALDALAAEIVRFYNQVRMEKNFDGEGLKNFSFIRKRIVYQLINYEMNREMLAEHPHVRFYDLAICFYVLLDVKDQGMLTFAVDDSYMDIWNTDVQEIYRYAAENTPKLLPASFGGIDEVIRDIQKYRAEPEDEEDTEAEEKSCGMYILSNNIKNRGASAIFYPHILEMIGEILQSDYYILPSSIHEVIILSAETAIDKRDLLNMVSEINSMHLEEEEVLSENVYFFDRKLKRILY